MDLEDARKYARNENANNMLNKFIYFHGNYIRQLPEDFKLYLIFATKNKYNSRKNNQIISLNMNINYLMFAWLYTSEAFADMLFMYTFATHFL